MRFFSRNTTTNWLAVSAAVALFSAVPVKAVAAGPAITAAELKAALDAQKAAFELELESLKADFRKQMADYRCDLLESVKRAVTGASERPVECGKSPDFSAKETPKQ
jgi:hypothetical protein